MKCTKPVPGFFSVGLLSVIFYLPAQQFLAGGIADVHFPVQGFIKIFRNGASRLRKRRTLCCIEFVILYVVLVALIGGGAAVAALFALGRKPVGCTIFGGLSFGAFRLMNLDFIDRGVIPSDSYDWGIAHTLFPIAAVILVGGALWMLL